MNAKAGFYERTPSGKALPFSWKKRIYLRDARGRFRPKWGHTPKGTRTAMGLNPDGSSPITRRGGIVIYRPDRVRIARTNTRYSR